MFFSFSLLLAPVACLNSFAASESDSAVGQSSISKSTVSESTLSEISAPVSALPAASKSASGFAVKPSRRLAFALGGGGTRGAAHVGVIKVLERNGIKPDIIVGTSMGAVIGGFYSAGVPIETIAKKFDDGKLMRSYMTVPLFVRVGAAPIIAIPRFFGYHPYDGLYKGNKFRKYLDRSLPQHELNIEELKIPFAAVVLNIVDGKPYSLTSGNLGYAMQASSAVPGLRKPVEIDGKLYVDGGVVSNVPVDEARAMGADFVIAVNVDERFDEVPLQSFRKMGSVSARMVKLQLARVDAPQIKIANIVIHPDVDGIGLISTSKKDARRAMLAGERAAEQALPAIKAQLQMAGLAIKPGNAGE